MTACTNKARGAVVAALAGVLALGAVPAVALATGTEAPVVDLMFADPEGAFTNARVVWAHFSHLGSANRVLDSDGDGLYETTFDKNKPVVLDDFTVRMIGGADAGKTFLIPSNSSDYKVEYFNRGADGKPTGDAIKTDISAVGQYVVKIEAVGGQYVGGVVYIPFDINAIDLKGLVAVEDNVVTYNAEAHDFKFFLDYDKDGMFGPGDVKLYEGEDYTVMYVPDGTDATEGSATEVKDEGTYRAVITGVGGYAGEVTLSTDIIVEPLDLTKHHLMGIVSTAAEKPEHPYYIWIDGVRYGDGSAIMDELKAEIDYTKTPEDSVWFENTGYVYNVTAAKSGDTNIIGSNTFTAYKVATEATFNYGKDALPESHDIFMNDPTTQWDFSAVTGHVQNGTVAGLDIPNADINQVVVNAAGTDVTATNWQNTPGSYTICVFSVAADGSFGALDFVTVNVYLEHVNADADAAVLYDVDGDTHPEIVTSVESTYDGNDLAQDIEVVVLDADGNELVEGTDFEVTYYNAEGKEVGQVVNAGTYTLKVTSDFYKLSGTTEMTVTVNKLDMSTVKAAAVVDKEWDNVGNVTSYLPWQADGVTLDELKLQYKDGDSWVNFPMSMVKATIFDAEGNELNVIDDEGVYTIKFEARNADAVNNFVVPADLTVTCIKDGTVADKDGNTVNHLLFRDVEWNDYFANAVDFVSGEKFMTGYKGTKLFGSADTLTRGQMACVLYNMAKGAGKVDENSFHYTETEGYETGFEDVQGKMFYSKAVAWAKLSGVVNGYDDTHFGPDDTITREQFAAMLMNYEKKFGDYEQADASVLDDFSDAASVSAWAQNAMAWAVENGVVNGTSEGTLIPTNDIVRADAACMVYNYAK